MSEMPKPNSDHSTDALAQTFTAPPSRYLGDEDDGPDDEAMCPACDGDGGDKWNDYCLPCSMCGGDGRLW